MQVNEFYPEVSVMVDASDGGSLTPRQPAARLTTSLHLRPSYCAIKTLKYKYQYRIKHNLCDTH